MGAGAAAGLSVAVNAASNDDIKNALNDLNNEDRKKLAGALNGEGALEGLVNEAKALDASDTNRSNIAFTRLSMQIAVELLRAKPTIEALEAQYVDYAGQFNKSKQPPFCSVEGVKFAINALKFSSIKDKGHVVIAVPFFMEFERATPATAENPNGEESPIQKFEEMLFLLSFAKDMSCDLIFVSDAIAEKKDDKDGGGSVALFKKALLAYQTTYGSLGKYGSAWFPGVAAADQPIAISKAADAKDEDFDSFTCLNGQLKVSFTSVEEQATKGGADESPEDKRKRLENRGEDGKLRERKGGAVLSGLEIPLPEAFAAKGERVIRVLMDGDCTIPISSFIGDAAYSVLQQGHMCYLANLKDKSTIVSIVEPVGGGGDAGTQARVQNRKIFFSGFIVPFLFPELTLKYKYTGTTQLPAKAFRGDIDFAKAKLPTVQPNVDLGCLALVVSYLNEKGGTIESGPPTIRDNIAASTMTSSDLGSEWNKTYGPIFTSAVGLCRTLKADEFAKLPEWLTGFIEGMKIEHYTALFGDKSTPEIEALFTTMKTFRDAEDRSAVLVTLKGDMAKIFPELA